MTDYTAPLVDSHFHIYTQEMPVADDAWHRPTYDASIEQGVQQMQDHGVPFGVISAASIYGGYNDYVRRALKSHRNLRGTVMPDFNWDIRVMEAYRDEGFTGVRFLWRPKDNLPDIDSEPYRRLLRRCADIGWHVHLTDRPHRIASSIEALENSGVNVVLDHMCLIDTEAGINDPGFRACLAAIERGKTWVKLSGGFRFTHEGLVDQVVVELIASAGWERLMWASDWPFAGFEDQVSYADCIRNFHKWVPDTDMRNCIGGRTPLKFFFA
ncbi:MAG: amidohydrolase family protein [Paracoccaceae bacterium]